jgi:hypothetical protein
MLRRRLSLEMPPTRFKELELVCQEQIAGDGTGHFQFQPDLGRWTMRTVPGATRSRVHDRVGADIVVFSTREH